MVSKAERFISKRMRDFHAGNMYGGKRRTYRVTDKKQALAIAYSEAREKYPEEHIPTFKLEKWNHANFKIQIERMD